MDLSVEVIDSLNYTYAFVLIIYPFYHQCYLLDMYRLADFKNKEVKNQTVVCDFIPNAIFIFIILVIHTHILLEEFITLFYLHYVLFNHAAIIHSLKVFGDALSRVLRC